jgi:hypothetical protein
MEKKYFFIDSKEYLFLPNYIRNGDRTIVEQYSPPGEEIVIHD